jgi:NADP-dependent 3-hydroxy acid dehydrogenase YdfG
MAPSMPSASAAPPAAVLVTGASRGLGRGIALELASSGFSVAVHFAQNRAAADETVAACRQVARARDQRFAVVGGDVARAADRETMVTATLRELGHLDALVNNAGIAPRVRADLLEATEESFDKVLSVNLKGPYFLSQRVASHFLAHPGQSRLSGGYKLVFVSSVSAYDGCRSLYGKSKLLVEAAVTRLGGVNVRPGIVHGDPSAGVYGRLWQSSSASLIPLIDGGRQRMLTVHREDLARVMIAIIDNYPHWKGQTVVIGHPDLITLRAMLEGMSRARGRSARFISVPSQPLLLALRCAERAGVRIRFRSDSLLTLMGEEPRVDRGVLQELKVPFRSLSDALSVPDETRV